VLTLPPQQERRCCGIGGSRSEQDVADGRELRQISLIKHSTLCICSTSVGRYSRGPLTPSFTTTPGRTKELLVARRKRGR
jgi:hypothetical protein